MTIDIMPRRMCLYYIVIWPLYMWISHETSGRDLWETNLKKYVILIFSLPVTIPINQYSVNFTNSSTIVHCGVCYKEFLESIICNAR